jgi:hypothetical protein
VCVCVCVCVRALLKIISDICIYVYGNMGIVEVFFTLKFIFIFILNLAFLKDLILLKSLLNFVLNKQLNNISFVYLDIDMSKLS